MSSSSTSSADVRSFGFGIVGVLVGTVVAYFGIAFSRPSEPSKGARSEPTASTPDSTRLENSRPRMAESPAEPQKPIVTKQPIPRAERTVTERFSDMPPAPTLAELRFRFEQKIESARREVLDVPWARATESSFSTDLARMTKDGGRVERVTCGSRHCVAEITLASAEQFQTLGPILVRGPYETGCATDVVSPSPESPRSVQVLFDCERWKLQHGSTTTPRPE